MDYVVDCLVAMRPCYEWFGVFCLIHATLLYPLMSYVPVVGEWYRRQERTARMGFNATTIACIHATIASSSALRAMLTEGTLNFFDLYSPSPITKWQLGFTGGYFMHDTAVLLYHTRAENRLAFIGHHLFSLFGVALGLRNDYGMWFIAFRLLTEISNPFMNMRGLLEMMGTKKSAPFSRFNGKLFVASFVLTRPPMLPLFWGGSLYHLVKNSKQLFTFDWPSLSFWIISGVALDYLNVIWLKKITESTGEYAKESKKE